MKNNQNDRVLVGRKEMDGFEYQILKIKDDTDDKNNKFGFEVVRMAGKDMQRITTFDNLKSAKECLNNLGKTVRIKLKNYPKVFIGQVTFWKDGVGGRVEIVGKPEGSKEKETNCEFEKFNDKGEELIEIYEFVD